MTMASTMTALPRRTGEKPKTGPEIPHVQFTQLAPPALREEIQQWIAAEFPGTSAPHTKTGPSEISNAAKMRRWIASAIPDAQVAEDLPPESAFAIFLDDIPPATGAVLFPPRLVSEFAHLHQDGSFHLALSEDDQRELLAKGWGEYHPLHSAGVNAVMLYGPRDAAELEVAKQALRASYRYAIG